MVARTHTSAEQIYVPPKPSREWRLVRFTWMDAQAMLRMGIIPEDASTELLDGVIVNKDRTARGQDPTDQRDGPVRYTVEDASRLVAQGILPEDSTIELLDGMLVYCDRFALREGETVEGVNHNYVLSSLAETAVQINSNVRHLRTQSTLICSETYAPLPDGMVLRGPRTDYRDRLPTAVDALCVIEVADSSYERDAGVKLFGYARAGIVQYIIFNLRSRAAEVYSHPDIAAGTYPPPHIVAADGELSIRVGDAETFELRLSDVLP